MKNGSNKRNYNKSITSKNIDSIIDAQFSIKKLALERSLKLLSQSGINVTKEEAEEIMEFLNLVVQLTIKDCISK